MSGFGCDEDLTAISVAGHSGSCYNYTLATEEPRT